MQKSLFLPLCWFCLLIIQACGSTNEVARTNDIISSLKASYAPDRRVALFDIEPVATDAGLLLKGESTRPDLVDSLRTNLQSAGIAFIDSISVLPEASLEGKIRGVVKISVANLRSEPRHSAELSTQATMGTPLHILKKQGGWYLVQTPDRYLAWVDSGGLEVFGQQDFDIWLRAKKIIFTHPVGFSYQAPDEFSPTVSDLVGGSIMALSGEEDGFYKVKYPDGRAGFIAKPEAQLYNKWLASQNPTGDTLVATSFAFMGLPYLWGGTSYKGVDCSGFTKTVFFMHGVVIPRDASQQVHTGRLVDADRNYSNLRAGDLLFFGRNATDSTSEKVVHVGMWIGNNEFIHASGDVHISSLDTTAANYDRYNHDRYLRTKRLLNQQDENILHLRDKKIF